MSYFFISLVLLGDVDEFFDGRGCRCTSIGANVVVDTGIKNVEAGAHVFEDGASESSDVVRHGGGCGRFAFIVVGADILDDFIDDAA